MYRPIHDSQGPLDHSKLPAAAPITQEEQTDPLRRPLDDDDIPRKRGPVTGSSSSFRDENHRKNIGKLWFNGILVINMHGKA